jgi:hypothetical protein
MPTIPDLLRIRNTVEISVSENAQVPKGSSTLITRG